MARCGYGWLPDVPAGMQRVWVLYDADSATWARYSHDDTPVLTPFITDAALFATEEAAAGAMLADWWACVTMCTQPLTIAAPANPGEPILF